MALISRSVLVAMIAIEVASGHLIGVRSSACHISVLPDGLPHLRSVRRPAAPQMCTVASNRLIRVQSSSRRLPAAPQMRTAPGTLQFSAFRGYFVILDHDSEEVDIPTNRIGKGLQFGARVVLDDEVSMDEPLVTAAFATDTTPVVGVDMHGSAVAATETEARPDYAVAATETEAIVETSSDIRQAPSAVPVPAVPVPTVVAEPPGVASVVGTMVTILLASAYFTFTAQPAERSQLDPTATERFSSLAEQKARVKAQQAEEEQAAAAAAADQAREVAKIQARAAAAASVAEQDAVQAAWTVQWSTPGDFAYYFNTRTCATSPVPGIEPVPGLLTKESLADVLQYGSKHSSLLLFASLSLS